MAANSAKKMPALEPANESGVSEKELVQRLGQVQTLLFGDAQRATTDRIAYLEDRILELEASADERLEKLAKAFDERTADMEKEFERRLTELSKEVNVRDRQQTQSQRRLVTNLGETIKLIAKEI